MSLTGGGPLPSIHGYEIRDVIGRGGFATVYRAHQLSVGREVALKVIASGALGTELVLKFQAECTAVGGLSWHPHVVALYDAGTTTDGSPFLVMDLLSGGSMGSALRRGERFSAERVLQIAIETADALSAAHEAGIIHRDVKPDNLLIGRRGEVQLSDFGIATVADTTSSMTGTFTGTIAYTAPELISGERPTVRSDIYSLGVTLSTLLSGVSPFHADSDSSPAALMYRIVSEAPRPLPAGVPAPLAAAITKAMARDPRSRHGSAAALLAELRGSSPTPTSGRASGATTRPTRGSTGRPVTGPVSGSFPKAAGGSASRPGTGPVSGEHTPSRLRSTTIIGGATTARKTPTSGTPTGIPPGATGRTGPVSPTGTSRPVVGAERAPASDGAARPGAAESRPTGAGRRTTGGAGGPAPGAPGVGRTAAPKAPGGTPRTGEVRSGAVHGASVELPSAPIVPVVERVRADEGSSKKPKSVSTKFAPAKSSEAPKGHAARPASGPGTRSRSVPIGLAAGIGLACVALAIGLIVALFYMR